MQAIKAFSGFSGDTRSSIPVPGEFFHEVLADIRDLNELKVILYTIWFTHHRGGAVRYICESDFLKDQKFIEGIVCGDSTPQQALAAALAQAVKRGVLLRGLVQTDTREMELFFLNTPLGRAAMEAIQAGKWRFSADAEMAVEIGEEPPNIYRLYEQHIAPLTPMMAETLREAESVYPPEWIEEAIRIAVEKNVRNWRYVEAILKRWKEEGKGERKAGTDTQEDLRRYAQQWKKSVRKSR